MIFWYVTIKLGEWVIWTGIALFFFTKMLNARHLRWVNGALALAFLFFGLADFIEYFTRGSFPWWLWAWKITGGLILFFLLLLRDYKIRGKAALTPWRFLAALVILGMALVCIFLEQGNQRHSFYP